MKPLAPRLFEHDYLVMVVEARLGVIVWVAARHFQRTNASRVNDFLEVPYP